jgi:hypothetical protein
MSGIFALERLEFKNKKLFNYRTNRYCPKSLYPFPLGAEVLSRSGRMLNKKVKVPVGDILK